MGTKPENSWNFGKRAATVIDGEAIAGHASLMTGHVEWGKQAATEDREGLAPWTS